MLQHQYSTQPNPALAVTYVLSLATVELDRDNASTANRVILEPDFTQLFRRTTDSAVTDRPGSRA